MPLPSRRLDLLLVPSPPKRPDAAEVVTAAFVALVSQGAVTPQGAPDEGPGDWTGFRRVRADLPQGRTVYGNRVGGFRASCAKCDANVMPAYVAAVGVWRQGDDGDVACGACGAIMALESVCTRPIAAPGTAALVFEDVDTAQLSQGARDVLAPLLSSFVVVASRVGR